SNAGFFTKDTWKAEFTEGTYEEGDIVLSGRYTFNVFEGSDFEDVLYWMNTKTFLICGFTTSLCIRKTVDAARKKGYNFIIVNDCSATFTGCLQKQFDRKFRDNITDSHNVIEGLNAITL
ncbi:MAG: isochorismatase family protein, partial [Bacteroidales bacterium]|nr:isochorismatase family protein [Bacteroidales bacterium]